MTNPAEAAKTQLDVGRQRELIAKFQRDGHADLPAKARLLDEMEQTLGTIEADYAAAQERLSQASVDEPSLARVERDAPM